MSSGTSMLGWSGGQENKVDFHQEWLVEIHREMQPNKTETDHPGLPLPPSLSVYILPYFWPIDYSLHGVLWSLTDPELWAQRSQGTCTCWLHRGRHESSISLSARHQRCWWAECSFSVAGPPAAWNGPCSSRARRPCVICTRLAGRAEGRVDRSTRCRERRGTAEYWMDTWRCMGWPRRSLSWPRCREVTKRSTGNWHLREDQRQNMFTDSHYKDGRYTYWSATTLKPPTG